MKHVAVFQPTQGLYRNFSPKATGCRQAPHLSVNDGESKRRIECLYSETMGGQDPIRKNKKDARLK